MPSVVIAPAERYVVDVRFGESGERAYLRDIEKSIRQSVRVIEDHPYHAAEIANDTGQTNRGPAKHGPYWKKPQGQSKGRGQRRRNPRRNRRAAPGVRSRF